MARPPDPRSRSSHDPLEAAVLLSIIALVRSTGHSVATTMTRLRQTVARLESNWELVLVDAGGAEELLEKLRAYAL